MGMPQIPPAEHRPSFRQTRIDLLESAALEAMSASHILNAQGEQTQAVVRRYAAGEVNFHQLQASCRCTRELLQSLIMKQWLLQQKLETVAELTDVAEDAAPSPWSPPYPPCCPPPWGLEYPSAPRCPWMPRQEE